jgi:hypothetical protein
MGRVLDRVEVMSLMATDASMPEEHWMSLYGPDSSTTPAFPPNANNGANGTRWARIEHPSANPLQPGTYYIKIQGSGNNTAIAAYTLSLTVTPIADAPQWPSIVGTWTVNANWSWSPDSSASSPLTFESDGSFDTGKGSQGTWIQSGQLVSWTYANGTCYTGALISATAMSGTMAAGISTGTWYATRQ